MNNNSNMKYAVQIDLQVCSSPKAYRYSGDVNEETATGLKMSFRTKRVKFYASDFFGSMVPLLALATPFISYELAEIECETLKRIGEQYNLEYLKYAKVIKVSEDQLIATSEEKQYHLSAFSHVTSCLLSIEALHLESLVHSTPLVVETHECPSFEEAFEELEHGLRDDIDYNPLDPYEFNHYSEEYDELYS